MKSLSTNKINSIIARLDAGQSYENIAAEIGVSKGVITKIRKQHRSDLQLSLGGRPSKLSENDIRHTIRQITSGKIDNAATAARALQDCTNVSVTPQTMRRALHKQGMKAVVKKKKPALSKKNQAARLHFAESHQYWTVDD